MDIRTYNKTTSKIDSIVVFFYICLIFIGFISINSATSVVNQKLYSFSPIAIKQLIWIAGAFIIVLSIVFSNIVVIDYFAYGFYAIAIALNVAVLFLGKEVSGAKSWFGYGWYWNSTK